MDVLTKRRTAMKQLIYLLGDVLVMALFVFIVLPLSLPFIAVDLIYDWWSKK